MKRVSSSVSTNTLMSIRSRSGASAKIRMPSTMMTWAGWVVSVAGRLAWRVKSYWGTSTGRPARRIEDVPDHEAGLERVGVVVVERRAFFQPQLRVIPVVAVVFQHDHLLVAEALDDLADDGRLARPRAARHPDDNRCFRHRILPLKVRDEA